MSTTTPTLPELFERVAAKVPEIKAIRLTYVPSRFIGGRHWYWGVVVADEIAESLIESACVRWLLSMGWCVTCFDLGVRPPRSEATRYAVSGCNRHGIEMGRFEGPTLAHALMRAVLNVKEQEGVA